MTTKMRAVMCGTKGRLNGSKRVNMDRKRDNFGAEKMAKNGLESGSKGTV